MQLLLITVMQQLWFEAFEQRHDDWFAHIQRIQTIQAALKILVGHLRRKRLVRAGILIRAGINVLVHEGADQCESFCFNCEDSARRI